MIPQETKKNISECSALFQRLEIPVSEGRTRKQKRYRKGTSWGMDEDSSEVGTNFPEETEDATGFCAAGLTIADGGNDTLGVAGCGTTDGEGAVVTVSVSLFGTAEAAGGRGIRLI